VTASAQAARSSERHPAYGVAFTDWLACACAGAREPAAVAVRATGDDMLAEVAFAATAGHVLDYDDTFADGVAHVSAVCAPAALVTATELGRSLGAALDAYAEGYEAMAALAAASHPALYDAGWHPTAVCAPVGAAVAAASLLGLTASEREHAVSLGLLRAGGTRGAFGSDGKAIQVGLGAAAGVQAALLARAGATVDPGKMRGPLGFEAVLGASWPRAGVEPGAGGLAVERNWIKLHPSCLGTHAPIDAAERARDALAREAIRVRVNPRARQAAHLDAVDDGLSAKFSIPYCVAHTVIKGPPRVHDFQAIDPAVSDRALGVEVIVDESLPEFGAVVGTPAAELARVPCPRGAPERPVTPEELAGKVEELAGDRLAGLLEDLERPAADALHAAGLRPTSDR
jgi:2-methylcitrate dehydratase PrpD